MKTQIRRMTLAAMLCGAFGMRAAVVEPVRSDSTIAREEAQQLLKDRNDARPKAQAAEQKYRDVGVRPEALGFEKAKAIRDEQAVTVYDRYVKTTKEMETLIKSQVVDGKQPPMAADIARFERLQAEVDLARIQGWLPAEETTESTLARQRARAALRAELMKHDEGKSALFNVFQVAKDLRSVEQGTNQEQRIRAHMRYVALVSELKNETDKGIEKGIIAPLEGKLAAQELKEARIELMDATRNK